MFVQSPCSEICQCQLCVPFWFFTPFTGNRWTGQLRAQRPQTPTQIPSVLQLPPSAAWLRQYSCLRHLYDLSKSTECLLRCNICNTSYPVLSIHVYIYKCISISMHHAWYTFPAALPSGSSSEAASMAAKSCSDAWWLCELSKISLALQSFVVYIFVYLFLLQGVQSQEGKVVSFLCIYAPCFWGQKQPAKELAINLWILSIYILIYIYIYIVFCLVYPPNEMDFTVPVALLFTWRARTTSQIEEQLWWQHHI